MSTKYVFIGAFAGKSKDKQKPYNRVTIAGINEDGTAGTYDLFTEGGVLLPNQDTLKFGDVVEPSYKPSMFPGGRQSLAGLQVVTSSPYFN
ncbi:MAG: hypothetical protein ACI4MS_06390 [Candidatus Coproplasma sp.]